MRAANVRRARVISTALFLSVAVAAVLLAFLGYRASLALHRANEAERVAAAEREASSLVDRVEQTVIDTENVIFHLLSVEGEDKFLARWAEVAASVPLARSVALLATDGSVRVFASKRAGASYRAFEGLFTTRVLPDLPLAGLREKPGFLKHVHAEYDGRYYLFAIQPNVREGRMHYTVLEVDMGTVVGDIFVKTFGGPAKTLRLAVTTDAGEAFYGEPFAMTSPNGAVRRFPTTLYRWKLQLEPLPAVARGWFEDSLNVSALFIVLALTIIIVGLLALAAAVTRARTYARLQADFVSHVSHELRTPLSLIRMFSELLALGKVRDSERAVEYYRIIMRESERLTRLIDNVLDFSRLERGRKGFDMKPVDLVVVVREAAEVFRPRLEQEGRSLQLQIGEDIPPVSGDANALGLALHNLLDNAVKYSFGEGPVSVTLRWVEPNVELTVSDRGPGIAPEYLSRVFDRFYRMPQSAGRKEVRGTGIGLALVKAIVSQHKGEVRATSIVRRDRPQHKKGEVRAASIVRRDRPQHKKGEVRAASTPEQGSIFTVLLPVLAAPVQQPRKGLAEDPARPETTTTLASHGEKGVEPHA